MTFTQEIIEDGTESSSYDISSGIVLLKIPKVIKGQWFEDLDLITKLMDIKPGNKSFGILSDSVTTTSSKSTAVSAMPINSTPIIQVLSDHPNDSLQDDENNNADEIEIDWNFPQSIETMDRDVLESDSKYGFNNFYQGYGKTINELAQELIDIHDIDHSDCQSRREQRLLAEELKFDSDYFMWDTAMNEEIQRLLEYKPESYKALKRIQKVNLNTPIDISASEKEAHLDSFFKFTEIEQEQMRNLPNKECNHLFLISYILFYIDLIDPSQEIQIYLGLVDIIYAYCYNARSTEGDDTVESAWTICRLSGTLSALDSFSNIESVLTCNLRRALSFPLCRSFSLAEKVYQDLVVMFKLGKRALLKCLLHIKSLLSHHESMFLMDRIYIVDYCIWIQQASAKKISSLASQLNHFSFTRNLCKEWELEKLESDAWERKALELNDVL